MALEVSPSGSRLYPLSKGLFVNVSSWVGEPRILIHAFEHPPLFSTQNSRALAEVRRAHSPEGLKHNSLEADSVTLYSNKRGVCSDEEGLEKLMAVCQAVLHDISVT